MASGFISGWGLKKPGPIEITGSAGVSGSGLTSGVIKGGLYMARPGLDQTLRCGIDNLVALRKSAPPATNLDVEAAAEQPAPSVSTRELPAISSVWQVDESSGVSRDVIRTINARGTKNDSAQSQSSFDIKMVDLQDRKAVTSAKVEQTSSDHKLLPRTPAPSGERTRTHASATQSSSAGQSKSALSGVSERTTVNNEQPIIDLPLVTGNNRQAEEDEDEACSTWSKNNP